MGGSRQVVENAWHAMEAHDFERSMTYWADGCEFIMPEGAVRGIRAIRAAIEGSFEVFPDLRHEVLECVEDGELVVLRVRVRATHMGTLQTPHGELPGSGRPLSWELVDWGRVREGRIAWWRAYYDQVAFLSQLGLQLQLTPNI